VIDPNFYDEDYFEHGVTSGKSGYQGYTMEQGYIDLAKDLAKYFKPTKALDLGCAKGYLVQGLRLLGIETYGIDVSEYAVSTAPENIKKFVCVGSTTDLSRFKDKEFDLITCYDILEHLTDEELSKTLPEITRVLKPSGYLTMKCPFIKYDWDADKSHINIKPEVEWITLFNQYGFENHVPQVKKAPWTWWDNRTLIFMKKQ
jgi:ubiquinone/menaquinone biosynthesis C-methylase UbiE